MHIVQRVRNLFTRPAAEWRAIDLETHAARELTKTWLIPLAGLAAAATALGAVLWGFSLGPVTVRSGLGDAIVQGLIAFVAMLACAWLLAWIINALAPAFSGAKNFDRAFAVTAFALTGTLVGGMAQILPYFATLLGFAGALWTLVLLYKGLPVMMKSPPGKAFGYTVVVVIAALVGNLLIWGLLHWFAPVPVGGAAGGLAGSSTVTIQTPAGTVSTSGGKLDEVSRKLEAAARDAERAGQQQDPQGVAKAATDALAAIAGAAPAGNRTPIAAEALKAWLPERAAGLPRASFDVQGSTTAGIAGSTAHATYRDGDRRIELDVLDAGGAAGLLAMIGALQAGERETDSMIERSFQQDRRRVTEKQWKHERRGELTIVLANGVLVTIKGDGVDLAGLQALAREIGLERLETTTVGVKG